MTLIIIDSKTNFLSETAVLLEVFTTPILTQIKQDNFSTRAMLFL
jgi:hypothetical protein